MNIFEEGPIPYQGDGLPIAPTKEELNRRHGKFAVVKPPKILPVYALDRETYLAREAELEARDGTEIKKRETRPHCGRPM